MRTIPVLIENVPAKELHEKLLHQEEDLEFKLLEVKEDTRFAEPIIVAAIITGAVTSFSLLINTIVTIWKTWYENDKNGGTFIIKGKDGTSIEFPVDTPEHKRKKIIEDAKKMRIDFLGIRED